MRTAAEFRFGTKPVFFGAATLATAGFPVQVRKLRDFLVGRFVDKDRGSFLGNGIGSGC